MAELTTAQLSEVRRMTDELDAAGTYADPVLQEIAQGFLCDPDVNGEAQFESDGITPNADFVPVWDLNAMAAKIWAEKAGAVAKNYDFSANGGQYSRSQWRASCMAQAHFYRSRRAIRSVSVTR